MAMALQKNARAENAERKMHGNLGLDTKRRELLYQWSLNISRLLNLMYREFIMLLFNL